MKREQERVSTRHLSRSEQAALQALYIDDHMPHFVPALAHGLRFFPTWRAAIGQQRSRAAAVGAHHGRALGPRSRRLAASASYSAGAAARLVRCPCGAPTPGLAGTSACLLVHMLAWHGGTEAWRGASEIRGGSCER
jgi:hypothetical protein